MSENERLQAVRSLLFDYVKSPSLRHIRDAHAINKLAREIVAAIDRSNSIWGKWDGQREALLKSALCCWVPVEDMREFLNRMPGPELTKTDVMQRMRALEEEPYASFPKEELQAGCLTLYAKEKAEGTELPAIIMLLREHVENEEARLRAEQEQRYRQWREDDRIAREQRLVAGADCPWTPLGKSMHLYCRSNGRLYRLSPTKEKRWNLHRAAEIDDEKSAPIIGTYQRRGDATKAVAQLAYKPEPRW